MIVAVGTLSALIVGHASRASSRDQAKTEPATLWGGGEPGVFRFRWAGHWQGCWAGRPRRGRRAHLARFGVLGPDDWRRRDDVQALTEADRDERRSGCWSKPSGSPRPWPIAPTPRATGGAPGLPGAGARPRPVASLEAPCRELRNRLGLPRPRGFVGISARSAARMEDYLLGVEARAAARPPGAGHYRDVIQARPNAFWAHYRSAAVACRLGQYHEAASYLEGCLQAYPDNPALRTRARRLPVRGGRIGRGPRSKQPGLGPGPGLRPGPAHPDLPPRPSRSGRRAGSRP
ncbi:MAG: hypothetical protein WKF75_08550 [Singulisphaera sp.]